MSLLDLGKNLLESAKVGATEEVRKLMTSGAPFTTDWLGTSPLHLAAQYGHVDTAEVLLRAGISRDARTKVERTPLHVAAQEGHLEIVELLLKHGADIEAKDMLKMTALHWAVERGHVSVINFLVKSGANVCATSKFFKSPINIALENSRSDLLPILYAGNGQHELATQGAMQIKNQSTKVTANLNPVILKPLMQKLGVTKTNSSSKNNNYNNNNNKTIPTQNVKNVTKPIILQGNTNISQKLGVSANNVEKESTEVEEEEDSDSSTSVLATLAALAEATAPNSNITTADTLQWLETHGIQMLPADNSTIVSSAIEGGQSISLTEAGKLALNWVKDHQNEKKNNATTINSKNQQKQVYTIVTNQSQLSAGNQSVPIMLVSSGQNESGELVQTLTFQKDLSLKEDEENVVIDRIIKEEIQEVEEIEEEVLDDREKLRLELEEMRKQAAEYKAQLKEKQDEAEEYKKKLQEMQSK